MATTIDVFIMEIKNVQTGSDPGNELELFGEIYGYSVENKNGQRIEGDWIRLWNRSGRSPIELAEGKTHEILDANINHNRQKIEFVKNSMNELLEAWRVAASSTANAPTTVQSTLNIKG